MYLLLMRRGQGARRQCISTITTGLYTQINYLEISAGLPYRVLGGGLSQPDVILTRKYLLRNHLHMAGSTAQPFTNTSYSPFELMYGYQPDITIPAGRRTNIPSLEERLDCMEKAQKDAEAALRLNKLRMKEAYERGKPQAHVFDIGDQVWLSSKDIKIHQPSPKLGPRCLGPFKVIERIGDLDYRLELPDWMRIHNVIHVDRLSPYYENGLPSPKRPEPVIVDGEEEWEVEEILQSRYIGRGLHYLVKWKGYAEEKYNSWEPAKNLANSPELVALFHAKNPKAPRKRNPARP